MGKCPLLSKDDSSEFMRSFAEQVGENTRFLRERYMDPKNVFKFSHGRSWEAPANEPGDKRGTFQQLGTETEIRLTDIAEGRAHVIFDAVNQVTQDMHDQMERMMFETMKEATDRTGQVVHAAGRPMPEVMYEMLDKMEVPLGKDGELSMPSMFVHPSQSLRSWRNSARQALNLRKNLNYLRRERKRRLVSKNRNGYRDLKGCAID